MLKFRASVYCSLGARPVHIILFRSRREFAILQLRWNTEQLDPCLLVAEQACFLLLKAWTLKQRCLGPGSWTMHMLQGSFFDLGVILRVA